MEEKPKDHDSKKEEPDFYMENGLLVFTASYHLKRGHCCKSGCRHCPYGFRKESRPSDGDQGSDG